MYHSIGSDIIPRRTGIHVSALIRYVLDARTATDHFPGIGRYTVNLARAMIPFLGAGEELILLHDPVRPSVWNLRALAGERLRVIDVPLSPFSIRQQLELPRLLRRLKADVYHSPYYLMPYRPGVPSLVTIYDLIPLRYPSYFTPVQRLIFAITVRLAARSAQRVIAVSQSTAHDLRHLLRLPDARISVILAAADPAFHAPTPAEVETVRQKYRLPERYVLHLSSNKPHKNQVRLVEAWASLEERRETTGCELVLAGREDPRYPEARHRIKALNLEGRVRVLGGIPDEDLPSLYGGASWFVFPSLYEGFGLPVLEAMACGTPVVCSNTSSLPEIVGDAAITFDPTDTEAMTQALAHAQADPKCHKELSERAVRRARLFRWERTAQLTHQCYREAITEVHRRHRANR